MKGRHTIDANTELLCGQYVYSQQTDANGAKESVIVEPKFALQMADIIQRAYAGEIAKGSVQ